jgi:rod shape determining protein RodA
MNRDSKIVSNIDWVTIMVYVALVIMGWLNIYAAVYNEEHKNIFDIHQRYGAQAMWIVAAFFVAIVILLIDIKFYTFFAYIIYGLSMLLLVAVLIFGKEINGARAWLSVGQFSIQPAEFAKFATALTIAKFMSGYNIKITQLNTLLILGLILFIPVGLIALQPDAGSILVFVSFALVLYREGLPGSILIFGGLMGALFFLTLIVPQLIIFSALIILGFILYFIIGKRYKETAIGALFFCVLATITGGIFKLAGKELNYALILAISFLISGLTFLVYNFFRRIPYIVPFVLIICGSIMFTFSVDFVFNKLLEPHQQRRMNILLGIEKDPLGMGYNVNQSLIAVGSGGLTGKGFLKGTQTKYNFVPEQSTDFIFCTVGEEWGFLGSFTVVILFVILMLRVINLAERQRSVFSRIYGYSVASIIFFHFFINIGMAIGVLPVIGIPLPFFSYGGSSLWSFTILLFILIKLDTCRIEVLK